MNYYSCIWCFCINHPIVGRSAKLHFFGFSTKIFFSVFLFIAMVEKFRVNTECIRFIGFLFFKEKAELANTLEPWHKKRHFDRLWNGSEPCIKYLPALVMLGFSHQFIFQTYPPEIGSLATKEALTMKGSGISPRPFLLDPTIEIRLWREEFLNLSNNEQMNRIDAYCTDIRNFRDSNNTNALHVDTIADLPKQETIDRLIYEFHFEISSVERRNRIVEWFSYKHPAQL